jgi:hypothetical protein
VLLSGGVPFDLKGERPVGDEPAGQGHTAGRTVPDRGPVAGRTGRLGVVSWLPSDHRLKACLISPPQTAELYGAFLINKIILIVS